MSIYCFRIFLPKLIKKFGVNHTDFKSLHYVLALAESRSISMAAKRLGISQPSLSRYIQNLNDGLGTPLFEHRGGRLAPTYVGEHYIAGARRILDLVQDLKQVSLAEEPESERQSFPLRVLRVVCPPSEGSYIHPFAILNMHKKYPNTKLILLESSDATGLLRSGKTDLAVTGSEIRENDLKYEPLIQDEVLLITEKNHKITNHAIWKPECKQPWVDINLLREEPLIQLSPEQNTRVLVDRLLRKEHIHPRILMQTCNLFTAVSLAAAGAGICFAPEIALRSLNFYKSPAVFSVGDPLKINICLSMRKNFVMDEQTSYFIQLIRSFL